jgi:glycosyltransferase involved in cell wall biosynthesis
MKVALVHDYIKEYGGAERVLKTLTELYPKAPIYTAFSVKGSTAEKEFRGKEIHESWLAPLLKIGKLYSPLRFLTPLIWGSFDLSKYDLVITSCSWYITRGFKVGPKTKVIAYCHTPPRWLYGYETSVGFTKYWPVKVYSTIVGHIIRMYDFKTAQEPLRNREQGTGNKKYVKGVDFFVANSNNVQARIKKFYRRDSVVIYPPVDIEGMKKVVGGQLSVDGERSKQQTQTTEHRQQNYFLIVSRLVGAKGLEEAINVFSKLGGKYKLKIVGEAAGYSDVESKIKNQKSNNVELLGRVSNEKLYELYAKAKGFIALARDEDFGMTVVEAQAAGTPVIAFNGGGFRESIVDGVTGILINDTDQKTLKKAIGRFNGLKWDKKRIQNHARKFSKERFEKEIG